MAEKKKIVVLMGGSSAERVVSLRTGTQVLNALDPSRYDVFAIDTKTGRLELPGSVRPALPLPAVSGDATALTELPRLSPGERPDCVFIALHGPGGEDGTVQGFLEMLGIPYTGSGVLASALAMDKVRCKTLFQAHNIPVPAGMLFKKVETSRIRRAQTEIAQQLGFPVVIKPNRQGSSFGTSIVRDESEVKQALEDALRYDDAALVEECVQGVEITVAVLGNDLDAFALPPVEIVPPEKAEFFDFESKYSQGESGATEICPARISEADMNEAKLLALECHRALGCRGMSRTDMFVTEDGCIVLETNTIPGMTPTSLLPQAASAAGIEFPALLDKLIGYSLEKSR